MSHAVHVANVLPCYPGRIPPALRGKKSRMRTQRSACRCQVTSSRHSYDTLHGWYVYSIDV